MPPARHASFAPHVAPDARLLILGSLPGARSLAERRYYAHPTNQFWRLLGGVIDRPIASLAYDDRLDALAGARVGLRSEEHTSELQSLMRISYAVLFLYQTRTQNAPT